MLVIIMVTATGFLHFLDFCTPFWKKANQSMSFFYQPEYRGIILPAELLKTVNKEQRYYSNDLDNIR